MAAIKTVRIVHPGVETGVLINEEDFDPKQHELFDKPRRPILKPVEKPQEAE